MVRLRIGAMMVAAILLPLLTDASVADAAVDACASPPASLAKFKEQADAKSLASLSFVDAKGVERTLGDFHGKPIVLNFWATWCAPCVKEMPALDRLAASLAGDGIVVLPLSADREGASAVAKFYEVNHITSLPIALDPSMRGARNLKLAGLPTTILIDASGQEVGRVVGEAEWDADTTKTFLRQCLASGR